MARYRRGSAGMWAIVVAAAVAATPARAEEKVETYPDGTQKAVYTVTDDGTRNGPFKEFFPDGKPKAQGSYRQGKLSGAVKEYHPSGRIKLRAAYREGQLAGPYLEYSQEGPPVRKANYRAGKLHGPRQEFAEGRMVKDEIWLDGRLLIPRSAARIAAELKAIRKLPIEMVGADGRKAAPGAARQTQPEAAMRALMAYRAICGVPYKDLKLDATYTAHAQAGAQMLARIGRLEHTPANPGMPEAQYRFALKGTSSSNISGTGSLVESVRMFMHDSDPSNIDRLGHRRWCINPTMSKTGFGSSGNFSAMWSFDRGRTEVPDFEYVAFPPQGLVPTSCFGGDHAWNVSLNPEKYRIPDARRVKVRVFPAKLNLRRVALETARTALPLGYFNVSQEGFGIPNCIIFRPDGVRVKPGSAYRVEIKGIETASGEEKVIEYLVAFFAL